MSTPSLSRTADTTLQPAPRIRIADIVWFVVIAYGFSWAVFLAYVVPNWNAWNIEGLIPYIMIGQFGPTVAAIAMTARNHGWAGVKQLLSRLLIVRFPLRWWAITFWLIGLTMIVTGLIVGLVSDVGATGEWISDKWLIVFMPILALLGLVSGGGPLGEELGWRGYLQPILIERWSPWISSVILGIIWAFWHLPLFVIADWRNGLDLPLFTLFYPISTIAISYGMYYLWKNSRGSILAAILFHSALNMTAANVLLPFGNPVAVYLSAVAAMALWALIARACDNRALPANPYHQ